MLKFLGIIIKVKVEVVQSLCCGMINFMCIAALKILTSTIKYQMHGTCKGQKIVFICLFHFAKV